MRSVRAAVVRQDALDRDAVVCEPLDGAVQDADSRDSGLVVMHLRVCHAGVVVDDGVDERGAELGVVPSEVVNTLGWGLTSERGVWAMVIVVMQPSRIRR